jgi:hypothetical protein
MKIRSDQISCLLITPAEEAEVLLDKARTQRVIRRLGRRMREPYISLRPGAGRRFQIPTFKLVGMCQ